MRRTRGNSTAGFTLVELVVASTLMALVLSGVYLTFTTAVRSWRSAESNYSTYEDARRALSLIERELHGIPSDAIHLIHGTSNSLEFVTVAQPLNVETSPSDSLLFVTYQFKGGRRGGELIREEAPVMDALPIPPVPPSRELPVGIKKGRSTQFVIAEGVRGFRLDYAWAAPVPPGLPGAPPVPVRIVKDSSTLYALPESIGVALELNDPGNPTDGGRSVFRTRIDFRGPTSEIPEDLRLREGL